MNNKVLVYKLRIQLSTLLLILMKVDSYFSARYLLMLKYYCLAYNAISSFMGYAWV